MKCMKVRMRTSEEYICPTAVTDAALVALYRLYQNRRKLLSDHKRRFAKATEVPEVMNLELKKALIGLTNIVLRTDGTTRKDTDDD